MISPGGLIAIMIKTAATIAGATDSLFSNVALLINGEAATTSSIVDTTGKALTLAGAVTPSTTQVKYGSSSMYFNGTDAYVYVASASNGSAFNFGTAPFTVEYWAYSVGGPTANPYVPALYTHNGTGSWDGNSGFRMHHANVLFASGDQLDYTSPLTTNVWTHIAICRVGNVITAYKNGVANGTLAYTGAVGAINNQPAVGISDSADTGGREFFNGYIDDFRITKGVARYTGTFTPPTAFAGTTDSQIANVSLLLNGDAVSSGSIVDVKGKALTLAGAVAPSTAQVKYGSKSVYFNGTNSYLYLTAASALFDFGTAPFTVEYWVYPTAGAVSTYNPAFYTHNSTGGAQWNVNNGFRMHHANTLFASGQLNYTSAIAANVWTHVAICRVGNVITAYKNGVANGTLAYTAAVGSTLNQPALGISDSANTGGREFFAGYLDDVRVTKGVARYTGTFTPPTASFPTN